MGDRVGSRHRVLAALGVVGALALTGCNAGNKPAPSGTSSTSSPTSPGSTSSTSPRSSTTTTTAPRPSLPPEATKHTDEGAKAFASYYMEEVSESYSTLETTTLADLAADPCPGCAVLIQSIEDRKKSGEHVRKRTFSANLTHVGAKLAGDKLQIDVAGSEEAVDVLDAKGVAVRKTTPGKVVFRTVVSWSGYSWLMADVKVVTA
jgi:hypothetical protein